VGLERDLELERRKNRDVQAASREKDKEYQKLKNQFDKIKRKTLLAPNALASAATEGVSLGFSASSLNHEDQSGHIRNNVGGVTIGQVAEGMGAENAHHT